ncbi:uncharacterized protein [Diabrotica undecimpunctata]|uniref:uncharacterized protein n=1 Tax=Diabrotica undecimpunctata TaxID=50387 RepID=UPI003B632924
MLVNNTLWWHGPTFLVEEEEENNWPKTCAPNSSLPDIRKQKKVYLQAIQLKKDFIKKYSDLNRLKRIVAHLFRFCQNCTTKLRDVPKKTDPLELSELSDALKCIIKLSQQEYFGKELSRLKKKSLKDCKMLNLNPFLDDDEIIRVGGRLNYSSFSFEKKHPVILSAQSHLAQIIARQAHLNLLHAGPQHTLANIRDQYWIINGRILVKNIVKHCIPCFRFKPTKIKPIMAPLPNMRHNARQPFEHVGVDYAGPIMIKSKAGRGNKLSKCYICLFICCVTKAVHIELVTDLSTNGFMLALKRFISRRGKPTCIYSDNGTNFLGAINVLKELGKFIKDKRKDLINASQKIDINWKFTPPFSLHFGGLWEAGIKSIKHHLRRVAKDLILTYEELYTILVEIEAILNSRPLSSLSDSVHDP